MESFRFLVSELHFEWAKGYSLQCLLYIQYSEGTLGVFGKNKYKTKDAGTKKFTVGQFLDYKMVDSIPVVKQIEDLQVIINQIDVEGMAISEPFQVASIIELPPLWNDFKNYLKHKL